METQLYEIHAVQVGHNESILWSAKARDFITHREDDEQGTQFDSHQLLEQMVLARAEWIKYGNLDSGIVVVKVINSL